MFKMGLCENLKESEEDRDWKRVRSRQEKDGDEEVSDDKDKDEWAEGGLENSDEAHP